MEFFHTNQVEGFLLLDVVKARPIGQVIVVVYPGGAGNRGVALATTLKRHLRRNLDSANLVTTVISSSSTLSLKMRRFLRLVDLFSCEFIRIRGGKDDATEVLSQQ